jgi:hypothetical protein
VKWIRQAGREQDDRRIRRWKKVWKEGKARLGSEVAGYS